MSLAVLLTCPDCSHVERLDMLDEYRLLVHTCLACGLRMDPLAGVCCVVCSYADWPCPVRQRELADSCGTCDS